MDRRAFVAGGLGLLAAPLAAQAQPVARIPSVDILRHGTSDTTVGSISALRQGSREIGYVEGQTGALEYCFSGEKAETLPALAADPVRLKVDVIFLPLAFGRSAPPSAPLERSPSWEPTSKAISSRSSW